MTLAGTGFRGTLLRRGEPGYERARVGRLFNARHPDRMPAAVLVPADDADVVRGVRLARAEGWPVSVRAGGHSWAAWSVRDGALLIDLAELRDLGYDPATRVATARPAVHGGAELAPFLSSHGRAFPVGHCETVGLGGYLLQGGQGWNGRAWGWGCENVLAVDVVTAAGELVRADATSHPDLYWAARGAGPGFPGVVTRFHLRTFPEPAAMAQDTWTFRLDDLEPLLAWLHDLLPTLHRTVEPVLAATRLPSVPLDPGITRPAGPVLLLHTTAMSDSMGDVLRRLRPLDSCPVAARRLGHVRGSTDLAREYAEMAVQNPAGHRYAVDCTWTDAPAAALAPALREHWSALPTERSFAIWYGWSPSRPRPDMAFSVESEVYLATYVISTDPADDDRHRAWVHTGMAALSRLGTGAYLGDTDFTRRTDRFLSDAAYGRLRTIRHRWDPDHLFTDYLVDDPGRLNVHARP
jgi:FAD/FMN-containing dehydrogenase